MIIISIIFLILGLLIHKFKLYFLIAGYNTMSTSEKASINIDAFAKYMGYSLYKVSFVSFIVGILSKRFPNVEIVGVAIIFFMVIYSVIKGRKFNSTPTSKAEGIGGILLFVAPTILVLTILGVSMSKVDLEIKDTGLMIESALVKFNDIEEVKLFDNFPKMSKVVGSGIGTHRKGTYDVEGIGSCSVYTSTEDDSIFIKTKEKNYIVNTRNKDTVKDIYKSLANEKSTTK